MTRLISSKLTASLLTFCLFVLTACIGNVKSDIEKEIRSLAESPCSATGSDLMLALCGWPAAMKLTIKSVKIDLYPQSDSKSGAGTADITAEKNGVFYRSTISFTYFKSYMGGHGSGGTELLLSNFNRETDVDPEIGNPASVREIKIGQTVTASPGESGMHFPDGTIADFYSVELPGDDIAIKIILTKSGDAVSTNGTPVGYIYQNSRLICAASYFGNRIKGGHTIIMVCSKNPLIKYSLFIEQLDDQTKANFIKPKR